MVNGPAFDSNVLVDLNARLRTLESRFKDLRQLLTFLRSNVQEIRKSLNDEIQETGKDLRGVERRLGNVEKAVNILTEEISLRAPKEEFDVLKKYLDYWDPTKFVTVDQLSNELKKLKIKK
ncbi:hypothetical protein COV11_01835 [Candidatus Woesearchaeota archaeon CG10_big_fil_rev_8_21_14_0_10_30_7]|nr:MAG: hypothetical protein COV11_01835 [Candidatus Woesearchaeota archaeon CG10_big_fil_rev_8_21_14_0_10_30_7]